MRHDPERIAAIAAMLLQNAGPKLDHVLVAYAIDGAQTILDAAHRAAAAYDKRPLPLPPSPVREPPLGGSRRARERA